MKKNSNVLSNPVLWLIIALTLGLAPFLPEPHVWEKLKWISSGAEGMRLIDWLDFIMHGTPWVMLIFLLLQKALKRK